MLSHFWIPHVCRYDQIRQQVAEDELRECTFHPKINHTSKQLAKGQQPGTSPVHHADHSEPTDRGTFGADPSLPFGTTRRVSLVVWLSPAAQLIKQLGRDPCGLTCCVRQLMAGKTAAAASLWERSKLVLAALKPGAAFANQAVRHGQFGVSFQVSMVAFSVLLGSAKQQASCSSPAHLGTSCQVNTCPGSQRPI